MNDTLAADQTPQALPDALQRDEFVLPLLEETARIVTRTVETGRVRIAITTESRDEALAAELTSFSVEVDRLPADELFDVMPEPTERDGLLTIPVVEETVVMLRKYRVVERILVRRIASVRGVTMPTTLHRQVATVERRPAESDQSEHLPSHED